MFAAENAQADQKATEFWKEAFSSSIQTNPSDPAQMIPELFDTVAGKLNKKLSDRLVGVGIELALEHLANQAEDPEQVVGAFFSVGLKHPTWLIGGEDNDTLEAIAKTSQHILFKSLRAVLDQMPMTPELIARAQELFDRIEKRYLPYEQQQRNVKNEFLSSFCQIILQGLARKGASARTEFIAMLDRVEAIVPPYSEAAKKLSQELQTAIIGWADSDTPWLNEPEDLPNEFDPSRQAVRRQLACKLGYPKCIYFGFVAKKCFFEAGKPYETVDDIGPEVDKIIARCAVRYWRKKYDTLRNRRPLEKLISANDNRNANEEALGALLHLVRKGDAHLMEELGMDVVYAVEILDTLDPDTNGKDVWALRSKKDRIRETPREMREALLSNTPDAKCFGFYLALLAAKQDLSFGGAVRRFFGIRTGQAEMSGGLESGFPNEQVFAEEMIAPSLEMAENNDNRKEHRDPARERFRMRFLLRSTNLDIFKELDDEGLRIVMDRVLFLLSLISRMGLHFDSNRIGFGNRVDIDMLKLPEQTRPRTVHFLRDNKDYLRRFKKLDANLGTKFFGYSLYFLHRGNWRA